MTDKEKIHQILSSLWKNDDSVGKMCYNQALQDVQTAIDLQEESVSDDLDEEIRQQHRCFREIDMLVFEDIARHFAEWQKQQMMKNAVDAKITLLDGISYVDKKVLAKYNSGDKVKLIIIKED